MTLSSNLKFGGFNLDRKIGFATRQIFPIWRLFFITTLTNMAMTNEAQTEVANLAF